LNYYFAPLEGITSRFYRNTHAKHFPGIDKYFAPFIVASQTIAFKPHEIADIAPENNPDINLVPQLMGNEPLSFIFASRQIHELGYNEININLGCPSGTVVGKHRGSGLLAYKDELKYFLDGIFDCAEVSYSIKTRLGVKDQNEFEDILDIYKMYPVKELIVHPRIQKDMYNYHPNMEQFSKAYSIDKFPICYNGDIFSKPDFEHVNSTFPELASIMLGRGCLSNPALIRFISGGDNISSEEFWNFHDELYALYKQVYSGDRVVMHKTKELWFYLSAMFENNHKQVKRIYKSQKCYDYDDAVAALKRECPFNPDGKFSLEK